MDKNVLIIHYNTPELTRASVLSVMKHTPDCNVTVFDNSDVRPFVPMDNVRIIDNTSGQLINFQKMISDFPSRKESDNNYGSAKHCYSIDYCFRYFYDGFVLIDSDAIVKKDISSLFDDSVVWVGQPHKNKKHVINIERLYPFCCYINTRMCRENDIHYFDGDHMWQLSDDMIGRWYDTGAWFLEVSQNLPHRRIMCTDYIVHYGNGSFKKNDTDDRDKWLEINRHYYE